MTRPRLRGLVDDFETRFTVESWRTFVDSPRTNRPDLVPNAERLEWTSERREDYDLLRMKHHSNLPIVHTPDTTRIVGDLLLQLQANLHARGTLCGGVITGPATWGKTTLMKDIGRRYEHWFRKQYPPEDPQDAARIIPVVMVGLAPEATAKKLNISIAKFYGISLRRRSAQRDVATRDDYKDVIQEHVSMHHTKIIMIDDIHYLRRAKTNEQLNQMIALNNHLKNLADELGVTFILSGINVDGTGLFDEGSENIDSIFSQIGGRMSRHEIKGFSSQSNEWKNLITAFEAELVLDDHEPEMLTRLAIYLHKRTNGSIGSLTNLLRQAALLAVTRKNNDPKNSERIDHALLQKIKSDRNAEINYGRLKGKG